MTCTFSTSQLPNVLRTWCALQLLTSKSPSRRSGIHFFDISTSKSAPTLVCFVHFDLEICVAPHGVYFFDIATSKSGLRPSVFYTFDFEMCFAPQRRATFHLSSGQMAPAALVSLLFNPPEPQISGKTEWSVTFFTFSRACIFFALARSLLWSSFFFSSPLWLFPPLLFHLSILSEVWLLNFLRQTMGFHGFSIAMVDYRKLTFYPSPFGCPLWRHERADAQTDWALELWRNSLGPRVAGWSIGTCFFNLISINVEDMGRHGMGQNLRHRKLNKRQTIFDS